MADTEKQLKDLIDQIKSELKKTGSDRDIDLIKEKIREAKDELKGLDMSSKEYTKYSKEINNLQKDLTVAIGSVSTGLDEEGTLLDQIFGSLKDGINANTAEVGSLTEAASDLMDVFDPTNVGANMEFWRDYDRRIREVGVAYGLSGQRLEDFRRSNIELEQNFVELGGSAQGLQDAIGALYDETNQTGIITKDFVDTLAGMKFAIGGSETELARYIASFNNLNISFKTTGTLLNDLRNLAEKSGLNTQKVLDSFSRNFEKLNTYSFKNGVQGMMEMVKQSHLLKIDMDSVLALSDKLIDPEQTMEFAANMQLLGGPMAQLGDFNQLMYDAAVAPEDLAKNIAKAAGSMGTFNRETGKLDFSFVDRQQLKAASQQLGITEKDMQKMIVTAKKAEDIKMSLNFKDLTEEQANILGAVAQFDTARGEYTVKMKDEKGQEIEKSIAELSDEDIAKLTEAKETEELKELKAQKFDAVEMSVQFLKAEKYDSPDITKAVGGFSPEIVKGVEDFTTSIRELTSGIKEEVFKPLEGKIAENLGKELSGIFAQGGEFIKGVSEMLLSQIKNIGDKDLEAALENFLKKQGIDVGTGGSNTTDNTEGRLGGVLSLTKFNEGSILKGLSHEDGGIPFTIAGKQGFEAEGGEVLLTKNVSKDPDLLGMASKINEVAGGKKLFEDGGIARSTDPMSSYINNIQKSFGSVSSSKTFAGVETKLLRMIESVESLFGLIDKDFLKLIEINETQLKNGDDVKKFLESISLNSKEKGGEMSVTNIIEKYKFPNVIGNLEDLLKKFDNLNDSKKDVEREKERYSEKTIMQSATDFFKEQNQKSSTDKSSEKSVTQMTSDLLKIQNEKISTDKSSENSDLKTILQTVKSKIETTNTITGGNYDISKINPSVINNLNSNADKTNYNTSNLFKPSSTFLTENNMGDKIMNSFSTLMSPTFLNNLENTSEKFNNTLNDINKIDNKTNTENKFVEGYNYTNINKNLPSHFNETYLGGDRFNYNNTNISKGSPLFSTETSLGGDRFNYSSIYNPTTSTDLNNLTLGKKNFNFTNLYGGDNINQLQNFSKNNTPYLNETFNQNTSNISLLENLNRESKIGLDKNVFDTYKGNSQLFEKNEDNIGSFRDRLFGNIASLEGGSLKVGNIQENYNNIKPPKKEYEMPPGGIPYRYKDEISSKVENNYTNLSNINEEKSYVSDKSKGTIPEILTPPLNNLTNTPLGINKIGEVQQGGLLEKRESNNLNNVTINGMVNVGGKIDFGTIKVDINGTSKEIGVSENIKNQIFSEVEKMLNRSDNKNLYITQMNQKNTGIDTGKKPVIMGITET